MKIENAFLSTMVSLAVTIIILITYTFVTDYSAEYKEKKIWVLPDYQSMSQVAEFEVTAYDAYSKQSINVSKWRDGKTALGRKATPGRTIAVDPRIIPFDSLVYIPGFGWWVAEDVGSAIKGYRIDMLLGTTGKAMKFGRKKMPILWVPPFAEDVRMERVKKTAKRKANNKANNKAKSKGKK